VTASDETTASAKLGDIALGDYVDLPSLTVAAYGGSDGNGGGAFSNTKARVQVVGVNSYTKNGNTGKHLVFQFKDIMVNRRMNETNTTTGGYAASEMRKYLTTVSGDANSGKFLAGLVAAGVPQTALWAPSRVISGAAAIADLVYLPSYWEINKTVDAWSGGSYVSGESDGNSAWFSYYSPAGSASNLDSTAGKAVRKKKLHGTETDAWWWFASPYSGSSSHFCYVHNLGHAHNYIASSAGGLAPVFCVK
ncbi:MAG: DUF6273 domain-containing protein, partial [Spirochaetaceae bacterium]|jgi:hypothetical protein|nr:DUF6273 domain-containing protein [Spirochaetaceae bacterium]